MNYVGKLLSNFKGFYNEINSATLTGAIDVVIVRREDESYVTSPWHVRFGKLGVLRSREKVVDIEINGEPADIHMKLGDAGEAFFVEETDDEQFDAHLATSPIPNTLEMMEQGIQMMHEQLPETIIPIEPCALSETVLDDGLATPIAENIEVDKSLLAANPDLTKELSIVVDDDSLPSNVLFESQTHFKPVSDGSPGVEIGIQTDLTGYDVETRAASRTEPSCESCVTSDAAQNSGLLQADTSNSKMPSFIHVSSEKELTKKVKEKRRRRRKKTSPEKKTHERSKSMNQLEIGSPGSGSSGEILEEGLFDMELSGDEVDNSLFTNTMGRTVSMPMIEQKMAWTNQWANTQFAASFHPFSDGDITPVVSPVGSRPPTPKSDTEYETTKYDATAQTRLTGDDLAAIDSVRWRWGELPESDETVKPAPSSEYKAEEKNPGGLFQFMRKTKKIRHKPEQEGIYLDDLNLSEMDPEIAALYLYQGKSAHNLRALREEDNESGRGASLPQSPVTVETGNSLSTNMGNMPELAISLCGGLKESEGMIPHDKFLQALVTYDEFCENPKIFTNPNLVVKMSDKYYNWQVAGPIIMSVLIFQRPLPDECVDTLVKQQMPKKETTSRRRGWFSWGRGNDDTPQTDKKDDVASPSSSSPASSAPNSPQKIKKTDKLREKDDGSTDEGSDTLEKVTVICETPETNQINERGRTESVSVATQMSPPINTNMYRDFRKSLKLSSEKIAKLNLTNGVNEVSFSVTTQYQGTCRCTAYIYLWKWDDRVIISDIDGTITKSDVLGQFLPMIGKDWSQVGIASLYNEIERNGYRFVYLSARAIGQSKITRDYLKGIRQGELGLPDGPLLLSPSSLISAFHKEVIERRPQDFKISCLRDIKALFPTARNPFYAGFGNKINDVWAYQAVNIPITRIFTVNHRGELRHELTCTFQSTYAKMTDTVDHLFPPLLELKPESGKIHSGNFPAPDEYSNFTYWREPLPDIESDIDLLLGAKDKVDKGKKIKKPN